jgi:hypothetical protein
MKTVRDFVSGRFFCGEKDFASNNMVNAAKIESFDPKEVRPKGVSSTKKALRLGGSAIKRSLPHKESSPAGRKCIKTELAAQRRLSGRKEVRQNGVSSTM